MKIYEIESDFSISCVEGDYYKDDNNYFYIPDDGYVLKVGIDGFLNKEDAINHVKEDINNKIKSLEQVLINAPWDAII
jgi:hypothetical protein